DRLMNDVAAVGDRVFVGADRKVAQGVGVVGKIEQILVADHGIDGGIEGVAEHIRVAAGAAGERCSSSESLDIERAASAARVGQFGLGDAAERYGRQRVD